MMNSNMMNAGQNAASSTSSPSLNVADSDTINAEHPDLTYLTSDKRKRGPYKCHEVYGRESRSTRNSAKKSKSNKKKRSSSSEHHELDSDCLLVNEVDTPATTTTALHPDPIAHVGLVIESEGCIESASATTSTSSTGTATVSDSVTSVSSCSSSCATCEKDFVNLNDLIDIETIVDNDQDDDDDDDDEQDDVMDIAIGLPSAAVSMVSESCGVDETSGSAISSGAGEIDPPLYDGAKLTVNTSMLLTATYYIRHGLNKEALGDLLNLIELHCPVDHGFKSTMTLFKKFFLQSETPVLCHYFCKECSSYIDTDENSCCGICQTSNTGYFVRVPLADQLKSIIQRTGVLDSLNFRKDRVKDDFETISDIYDGQLYKDHFDKDGMFRGETSANDKEIHISFQINTDGVAIFKSTKASVWPLYATINELPPELRYRRDNKILMGVWYCDSKPDMKVFLRPFLEELVEMRTSGITAEGYTIKGIVLSTIADAPARCLLLNFNQFNGKHGCPCCYAEGSSHKVSEKGYSRIYEFNEPHGHGRLRTNQESLQLAAKVEDDFIRGNRANVVAEKGVKGFSPLVPLKYFDIIRGSGIDYMHCIVLGVTKRLLHLWFDSCHSKDLYSIREHSKDISLKLTALRPPNLISRLPRPLDDIPHWKASELRSFLLYYSIPILSQYLRDEYLRHYNLLVSALYLLLQESISKDDIERARQMLTQFCRLMPTLYDAGEQTFNLHCLLHLCDKVQDLGPLWAQSCFFYESLNGNLRKLFHGSQSVDKQILFAVSVQMRIPRLACKLRPGSCS